MFAPRIGLFMLVLGLGGCEASSRQGEVSTVLPGGSYSAEVGGIYASRVEEGGWRIVRVLALDAHTVHLRSYTDRFRQPPADVDPGRLTWFMGHLPVDRAAFESEPRVLVEVEPVAEDELEGYRYYLEAMSGPPPR